MPMRPNPWPLLRRLARRPPGEADPVSDTELLARFARDRDQAAFELLVWRHGPMVLGACRRILRDAHLAEDAFQAAFLILARKAGSVRSGGTVAGWLHRVARRVAVRAAKQHKRIEPLAADPEGRPSSTSDAELQAILDAEIDRLPDRYRLPLVLCYLDGRTTDDAARLLGVPRGTILSRLATARQRLAARLTRRGITAPATLAAVAGSGTEVISTETVTACVSTAVRFASGVAVPGEAVQLAEGVIHMGTRKIVTAWAAMLITTAGVGTGIAVMADGPTPKAGVAPVAAVPIQPDKPTPTPKSAEKEQAEEERRRVLAVTIDQLLMEREKLNAKTDDLQRLIAQEQRAELDPHVIQAMGAVLTEAELTLFRTELELRGSDHKVEDLRRKIKEAVNQPADPEAVNQLLRTTPAVVEKDSELRRKLEELDKMIQMLARDRGQDDPRIRRTKDQVAQLEAEREKAATSAHKAAEKSVRDREMASLKRQLVDAESDLQQNQRTLDAVRKRRDEIVSTLAKANTRKQSADVQRLEAELQTNREMARHLARLAMELELKMKGLPVPNATQPPAPDDKLDRILRELAELRAEVRRVGERK
jgi:RNA polymerase sigma factor (sigma-70 family)